MGGVVGQAGGRAEGVLCAVARTRRQPLRGRVCVCLLAVCWHVRCACARALAHGAFMRMCALSHLKRRRSRGAPWYCGRSVKYASRS